MGNIIENDYEDIPRGLKPCKTQVTQSTVKDNLEAAEWFKEQCKVK